MPDSIFRITIRGSVVCISLMLGCDGAPYEPALRTSDSGNSYLETPQGQGSAERTTPSTSPEPLKTWRQAPELVEPWASWEIGVVNGTLLLSTQRHMVVAFGPTRSPDILPKLYERHLTTLGWTQQHQWTSETQTAASWQKDEARICMLFSPHPVSLDDGGETPANQVLLIELPGPDSVLGNCERGARLPVLTMEAVMPKTESPAPSPP